jgi:hypothetical protein
MSQKLDRETATKFAKLIIHVSKMVSPPPKKKDKKKN